MRKYILLFSVLIGCLTLALWGQSQSALVGADGFSRQEWTTINTLSPLPALPVDSTNKYRDSSAAALLGQMLFFEPRLSGPIQAGTPQEGQLGAIGEKGTIACRNCHSPNRSGFSTSARTTADPFRTPPRSARLG